MNLAREVDLVQNAALGAVLEWRFCIGYSPPDGKIRGIPIQLIFVVLPICLHEGFRELLLHTREASGLRKFEEKLRDSGADRVWAVGDRAALYRKLSVRSLAMAVATHLVRVETSSATVWVAHSKNAKGVPQDTAPLLKAAERLGIWCGGYSLHEVAAILSTTVSHEG